MSLEACDASHSSFGSRFCSELRVKKPGNLLPIDERII